MPSFSKHSTITTLNGTVVPQTVKLGLILINVSSYTDVDFSAKFEVRRCQLPGKVWTHVTTIVWPEDPLVGLTNRAEDFLVFASESAGVLIIAYTSGSRPLQSYSGIGRPASRSTDGGETWTTSVAPTLHAWFTRKIVQIIQKSPFVRRIYLSSGVSGGSGAFWPNINGTNTFGTLRSDDNGATWGAAGFAQSDLDNSPNVHILDPEHSPSGSPTVVPGVRG